VSLGWRGRTRSSGRPQVRDAGERKRCFLLRDLVPGPPPGSGRHAVAAVPFIGPVVQGDGVVSSNAARVLTCAFVHLVSSILTGCLLPVSRGEAPLAGSMIVPGGK